MFCDELNIHAIAGKGGDGCSSFRREKFVPKGGPDGGDGGHGGDIIIRAVKNLNTLNHLAHQKIYRAKNGVSGKGKKMHGKNSEALVIEVPKGTIIYNQDKTLAIVDLEHEGSEFTLVRGGRGGQGNARFKNSIHQAPKFAEMGEPGQEKKVILELKLVADVGLIGLPSAGKSTLISVISNAKPKIAAYHFTTLAPNLGIVNLGKFGGDNKHTFVVADIPGLIEGASEGKGLGHQFLKHIARTKLLVHIIDGSLDNIEKNYKTITKELKDFDKKLAKRKEIIVINKIDLLSDEELDTKITELKKTTKKKKIFTISGVARTGLKELIYEIVKQLDTLQKEEKDEITRPVQPVIPILQPHLTKIKFKIEKTKRDKNTIFHIYGFKIEQITVMTDIKSREGLERIYIYLEKSGIKKLVEKDGAKYGDIYKIKDKEIPYRK